MEMFKTQEYIYRTQKRNFKKTKTDEKTIAHRKN